MLFPPQRCSPRVLFKRMGKTSSLNTDSYTCISLNSNLIINELYQVQHFTTLLRTRPIRNTVMRNSVLSSSAKEQKKPCWVCLHLIFSPVFEISTLRFKEEQDLWQNVIITFDLIRKLYPEPDRYRHYYPIIPEMHFWTFSLHSWPHWKQQPIERVNRRRSIQIYYNKSILCPAKLAIDLQKHGHKLLTTKVSKSVVLVMINGLYRTALVEIVNLSLVTGGLGPCFCYQCFYGWKW